LTQTLSFGDKRLKVVLTQAISSARAGAEKARRRTGARPSNSFKDTFVDLHSSHCAGQRRHRPRLVATAAAHARRSFSCAVAAVKGDIAQCRTSAPQACFAVPFNRYFLRLTHGPLAMTTRPHKPDGGGKVMSSSVFPVSDSLATSSWVDEAG